MKRIVLAAALTLVGAGQAQAGLFTVADAGGTAMLQMTTPASNNTLGSGFQGYSGGDLYLTGTVGQLYEVTFTFYGSESGYANYLNTPGGSLPEAAGSVSFQLLQSAASVLVPFNFTTCGATLPHDLQWVVRQARQRPQGFYVLTPSNKNCGFLLTGDSGFVAFDDSGAGPDDNHDDGLVVRRADGGAARLPRLQQAGGEQEPVEPVGWDGRVPFDEVTCSESRRAHGHLVRPPRRAAWSRGRTGRSNSQRHGPENFASKPGGGRVRAAQPGTPRPSPSNSCIRGLRGR